MAVVSKKSHHEPLLKYFNHTSSKSYYVPRNISFYIINNGLTLDHYIIRIESNKKQKKYL